jgi:hypothetical protein
LDFATPIATNTSEVKRTAGTPATMYLSVEAVSVERGEEEEEDVVVVVVVVIVEVVVVVVEVAERCSVNSPIYRVRAVKCASIL